MMKTMDKEEARGLYRHLSTMVDENLKLSRNPNDRPTDGNVAVLTVFIELEKMGYIIVKTHDRYSAE
jgi:hypothetical protein